MALDDDEYERGYERDIEDEPHGADSPLSSTDVSAQSKRRTARPDIDFDSMFPKKAPAESKRATESRPDIDFGALFPKPAATAAPPAAPPPAAPPPAATPRPPPDITPPDAIDPRAATEAPPSAPSGAPVDPRALGEAVPGMTAQPLDRPWERVRPLNVDANETQGYDDIRLSQRKGASGGGFFGDWGSMVPESRPLTPEEAAARPAPGSPDYVPDPAQAEREARIKAAEEESTRASEFRVMQQHGVERPGENRFRDEQQIEALVKQGIPRLQAEQAVSGRQITTPTGDEGPTVPPEVARTKAAIEAEKQIQAGVQQARAAPPPARTYLRNMADEFARGIGDVTISTAAGAVRLGAYAGGYDNAAHRLANWIGSGRDAWKEAFPGEPTARSGDLWLEVMQGMGSSMPFMATGVASAMLGLNSRAASALIASTGAFSQGEMSRQEAAEFLKKRDGELRQLYRIDDPELKGAARRQAQEAFDRARNVTADDLKLLTVFLVNGAMGTSEAVPISNALERINTLTGGKIMRIAKAAGYESVEEFIQEGAQNYVQNVTEQLVYNPEKSAGDGVERAMIVAAIAGAVQGGLIHGAGELRKSMKRGEGLDARMPAPVEPAPVDLTESPPPGGPPPPPPPGAPGAQPTETPAPGQPGQAPPAAPGAPPAEPGAISAIDRRTLRKKGYTDDQIESMSPAERTEELGEAAQQGVVPEPEPVTPVTPAAEPVAEPTPAAPAAEAPAPTKGEGTKTSPVKVETADDVEAAAGNVDTKPTPAQQEAGNYEMGHVRWPGIGEISIETRKGATRAAPDGSWYTPNFPAHYGRIKGTVGADGQHVDAFMGGNPSAQTAYIIDQYDPDTGKFDEHKVMLGFLSEQAAGQTYLNSFTDGRGQRRLGGIKAISIPDLKAWLDEGKRTQPFAGVRQFADPEHLYAQAVGIVRESGKASTSYLQRMLKLPYPQAARLLDRMEREGIVGPIDNVKGGREVLPEKPAPEAPATADQALADLTKMFHGQGGQPAPTAQPATPTPPTTGGPRAPVTAGAEAPVTGGPRAPTVSVDDATQAIDAAFADLGIPVKGADQADVQQMVEQVQEGKPPEQAIIDVMQPQLEDMENAGKPPAEVPVGEQAGEGGGKQAEGTELPGGREGVEQAAEPGERPETGGPVEAGEGGQTTAGPSPDRGAEAAGPAEPAGAEHPGAEPTEAAENAGLTAAEPETVDSLKQKLVLFASGMSRMGDLRTGGRTWGGYKSRGIGVDVGELTMPALHALARAIVDWKARVFVDSGAFSMFKRNLRKDNIEEELGADKDRLPRRLDSLDFDKILARYDELTEAIEKHNEAEEQITPPMVVMPDIVGDQAGSLALVEKYKKEIATEAAFNTTQPIVPIQKGELTLAQAYRQIVDTLGTDRFIVGIPSNEKAVSNAELLEFLKEARPTRIHFLGSAAASRLAPKLQAIVDAGIPIEHLSADANILRSALYGKEFEGTRAEAIEQTLGEHGEPETTEHIAGPPPKPETTEKPKPTLYIDTEIDKGGKKPRIEDAGEKIGGARKDQFTGGLSTSDIKDMSGGERHKLVTKDRVWPRPDYAQLVQDGVTPEAAYLIKSIYDRLPGDPNPNVGAGQKEVTLDDQTQYITVLHAIRDEVAKVKTREDLKDLQTRVNERVTGSRAHWSTENFYSAVPRTVQGLTWDHPATIPWRAYRAAKEQIEKTGWPNVEPWQRIYRVAQFHRRTDWAIVRTAARQVVQEGFATKEAAAAAAKQLYESRDKSRAEGPERPHLDKLTRKGPDVRQGRDADSPDFEKVFGFRGVQFGNWVANDERQKVVNHGYEALHDLARVLNIPPIAVSLNGTMGIAFGARGKGGKVAAHYDPAYLVVNMTKLTGAGSFAHEWGHALDHYLGEVDSPNAYGGAPKEMSGGRETDVSKKTYRDEKKLANLSPPLRKAALGLMQALHYRPETEQEIAERIEKKTAEATRALGNWEAALKRRERQHRPGSKPIREAKHQIRIWQGILDSAKNKTSPQPVETQFYKDAQKLSGSGDYWHRPNEMFARSFEAYVYDKLAALGHNNDYLVQGVEPNRFGNAERGNPYPAGAERAAINAAYDRLFRAIAVAEGKLGAGTKIVGQEREEWISPEVQELWQTPSVTDITPVKPVTDGQKIEQLETEMADHDQALEDLEDGKTKVNRSAALAATFATHLRGGGRFETILVARKMATEAGFDGGAKGVEEAMELALVTVGREIAADATDPKANYEKLVDMYGRQPRLSTRTSTSMRDQAYSTPVPLAYLASRLVNASEGWVLEPTAGNGALLIEVDPTRQSTTTNEINGQRATNLSALGFSPTGADASEKGAFDEERRKVDVVLANPPFGTVLQDGASKTFDMSDIQTGYRTNEVDHVIALRALETMRDGGRAVLILGSVNKQAVSEEARKEAYNAKAKREFFKVLYDRYNIRDHFTVAGELYERQGAGWPVDVIVIDRRGKADRPLPAVSPPRVLRTWEELGGLVDAAAVSRRSEDQAARPDEGRAGGPTRTGDEGVGGSRPGGGVAEFKPGPVEPGQVGEQPVRRPGDEGPRERRPGETTGDERGVAPGADTEPHAERQPSGLTAEQAVDAALADLLGPQEGPKVSEEPAPPAEQPAPARRLDSETQEAIDKIKQQAEYATNRRWPGRRFSDPNWRRTYESIRADEMAKRQPEIDRLMRKAERRATMQPRDGELTALQARMPEGYTASRDGTYFVVDGPNGFHVETNNANTALAEAQKDARGTRGPKPPKEKTTSELLDDALSTGMESADAALSALTQLFGGGKQLSMGIAFTPENYGKAKGLLTKSAEKFSEFAGNIGELAKRLVNFLREQLKWTNEAIADFRPFLIQFVRDVQSGAIQLTTPKAPPKAPPAPGPKEKETAGQVEYRPRAKSGGLNTLVPVNMRTSIEQALDNIEKRVGQLDTYIGKALGYTIDEKGLPYFERKNAAGEMEREYPFSAEQVDALALALDNIEKGKGFIVGDQTGIGKGRVVAGVLRFAMQKGHVPIFVTAKPNLYGDIYRDMVDIGIPEMIGRDLRIVETNALDPEVPLNAEGTKVLRKMDSAAKSRQLAKIDSAKAFHANHDVLFTTYDQMQTFRGGDTLRRQVLRLLAPDAVFAFDESHMAGGQGDAAEEKPGAENRAQLTRNLIDKARGVFYSSATYAKRPDVMDLYRATDMMLAVAKVEDLAEAIAKGGVPMQQAVAAMLAKAGQYIRRERSFDGVTYDTPVINVDRERYDNMSSVLAKIQEFSRLMQPSVTEIDADVIAGAGAIGADASVGDAGASSTLFTSVMHNLISQMLLGLKAKAVAQMAIEALQRGEKPVITLANTMESLLSDVAEQGNIAPGQVMNIDFGAVLQKYLDRTRTITIKKPFTEGPGERYYIKDEELTPEALEAYEMTKSMIEALDLSDMPGSPIDRIKQDIIDAGYTVGEITGRNTVIDYSGAEPVYRTRPGREISIAGRRETINGFNDGAIDVILLNQAGSTGLSLHSSEKYKNQQQRHMMIAQAEANIDTHMQMLGRVHRTGQVIVPKYSQLIADIPAEKRPAAVLSKKMASLNANTTASRGGAMTAKDTPDFMNLYGDRVVGQLIVDDPELNERLANPLRYNEAGRLNIDDAARKVTGRIPMLPLAEQEELYERIEADYKSLIEQLDAAGENALEAKTMNLRARPLERWKVVDEKDQSGSPFAQPVYIEDNTVTRPAKPFLPNDFMKRLHAQLGTEFTPVEKGQVRAAADLLEALQNPRTPPGAAALTKERTEREDELRKFDKFKREVVEAIQNEPLPLPKKPKQKEGEEEEDAQGAAASTPVPPTDPRPAKATKELARLNEIRDRWSDLHELLPIGTRMTLLTTAENITAVLTRIEHSGKAKNNLALSTWKAHFAVAHPAGTVIIPFSRLFREGKSGMSGTIELRPIGYGESSLRTLYRFQDMSLESREQRYIATGNMLAAYDWMNNQGQIVNYTDEHGGIQQGILAPRSFDLEKTFGKSARPIQSAEKVVDIAKQRVNVLTRKGDVALRYQYGVLTLSVPLARRKGGKYFLDQALTRLLGDFERKKGMMRASKSGVSEQQAIDIVSRAMEIGAEFIDPREAKLPPGEKLNEPEKRETQEAPAEAAPKASIGAQPQRRELIQSPAVEQHRARIEQGLSDIIERTLGKRVRVQFSDTIAARPGDVTGWGGYQAEGYAGLWTPADALIQIAMAPHEGQPGAARVTAHHEAYHAVEDLFFPEESPEFAALWHSTPRLRDWIGRTGEAGGQRLRTEGLSENEVRAIAYSFYARQREVTDRMTGVAGIHFMIRRGFERMLNAMRRIRSFLEGYGYRTAEDVFSDIYEGKYAQREPARRPAGAPQAAISYRRRAARPGEPEYAGSESVKEAWNMPDLNAIERTRELLGATALYGARNVWDQHIDFLRTQKAVEALGRSVPESMDMYLAATNYAGRPGEQIKDAVDRYWIPLYDEMAARGVTPSELDDYLQALAAPRRNERIRQIDPANDAGSGMSDQEAADIMDRLAPRIADFEALAEMAKQVIRFNRQLMVRSGLETQDTVDQWEENEPDYMPFKGFAEQGEDEIINAAPSPSTGKGYSTSGPETLQALGRFNRADSVLVNLFDQMQRTIMRAEKNRVMRTALRFMQANPSRYWQIGLQRRERVFNPITGMVEWRTTNLPMSRENLVAAKVGGRTYWIEIKHDGLLNALRSIGLNKMNDFFRFMNRVTREYSRFQTAKNPEFVLTNLLRDLQDAAFNLSAEQQDRLLARYAVNMGKGKALFAAMLGVGRHEGSDRVAGMAEWASNAVSPEFRRLFEEWRQDGGKISHYGLKDIDEIKSEIMRELNQRLEGPGEAAAKWTWRTFSPINGRVVKALEAISDITESTTRLAVYIAAREVGMSRGQAAALSRRATVDFNKGGPGGVWLNAIYAFSKAGILGNINLLRSLRKSKTARRVASGLMMAGFLMTYWNMAVSPEDKEKKKAYEKLKYWERERNIIIYWPGDGAAKIPLGYGLNAFWMVGEQAALALMGKVKPWEALGNVVGTMAQAFNPFGSEGSWLDPAVMTRTIIPTFARFAPDFAMNKTWTGASIHPDEMPWQKGLPHSERSKITTPHIATATAEFLNRITGGNKVEPGMLDLYPDSIAYAWNFAGGGLGRFLANSVETARAIAHGDDLEVRNMPFVRRFVVSDNSQAADSEAYYKRRSEVFVEGRRLREATKLSKEGEPGMDEVIDRLRTETGAVPGLRTGIHVPGEATFQEADKRVNALRKRERAVRNDDSLTAAQRKEEIKGLREEMREVMGTARERTAKPAEPVAP